MGAVRLTRRGRVVLAVAVSLVAAWLAATLWQGYGECMDRGYSSVVCAE